MIVEHMAQPGKPGRAGAAGVAQRGDAALPAEMVGVAAHVMRVDKDVGVDVDKARGHVMAVGADRPGYDGDQSDRKGRRADAVAG